MSNRLSSDRKKYRSQPHIREKERLYAKKRYDRIMAECPEFFSKQAKEYRHKNPKKRMILSARARAASLGFEFSITEDDFEIPTNCPILGIELFVGSGRCGPNSPSLDRINSSIGYVPGNVQVISNKANTIKNNATLEELVIMGAWASEVINEWQID